jgi:hypothetical protein
MNCPIDERDVPKYHDLVGPSADAFAAKATAPAQGSGPTRIQDVIGHTLHADVMSLQGHKANYLVTVDDVTNYVTIGKLENMTSKALTKSLTVATTFYKANRHDPRVVICDGGKNFAGETTLEMGKLGVTIEPKAPEIHAVRVERMIRVIKERVRAIISNLGNKGLPDNLLYPLLQHVVQSINLTPNSRTGHMSPRHLVTGKKVDYKYDFKGTFGEVGMFRVPIDNRRQGDTAPRAVHGIIVGRKLGLSLLPSNQHDRY